MSDDADSRKNNEEIEKKAVLEKIAKDVVEELHLDPPDLFVARLQKSADFKSALSIFVRKDELGSNDKDFIAAFKERMTRVAMRIA